MVVNYELEHCRYIKGGLKPYIFILPKETTRIDYMVEDGKCEIRNIYATNITKIEGFQTVANVTEAVDNRLNFTSTISLSLREKWGEAWVVLLNQLKGINAYVIIEDTMGNQYIQSPEFTSAFSYTYNFDTASNNGHVAQITYRCDSNNPLVILNGNISETNVITSDCAYGSGQIRNLRMTPYQYAFIDNDVETGQFTTITCTGGEAMHRIEFIPTSFQFRQQYDGRQYQERLTFRIPLSDYKYYFRYNLVAFKENRYAVTFETSEGNWIATGFEFGMMPTYTVETSEDDAELNIIEITLQHVGQNSIFYCSDREPEIIDSETNEFIPVTQQIKDPVTGVMLSNFKCTSKTEAIYTLVQMTTESGVPTDRYMCLQGYEQYYANLDIIGTYTSDADLGFELTFQNYDCATYENCVFEKMTKEVYSFSKVGDYYDVHIKGNCDWTLSDIPSWINASIMGGTANTEYTVRFTSRQDATEQRIISYASLNSYQNTSTIQFILEEKVDWINPVEHDVDARSQTIESYVNLAYDDYEICGQTDGITVEKIRGTSSVRIRIPENQSETSNASYTVKLCNIINGESGYIYINQDNIYSRWVEDTGGYICTGGNSYRRIVKYKGYTSDNINIRTEEYTTGSLLVQTDPRCHYDGGDGDKYAFQWRDVEGTVCIGTDLYSKQRKWETNDGGSSWNPTEEYRENELIESGSSQCDESVEKQTKMIVDESRYDCIGTESYYMQCEWWSTDGVQWFKTSPEVCELSTTLRKENDPQCGGGGTVPGYNEKWEVSNETYCKEGYLFYLERKSISGDGGITWTQTDEYREGSVNSGTPCTDSSKTYVWRKDDGTFICDGYDSYYAERYYYYYNSNPTVYILAEPLQSRRSSYLVKSNDPLCGWVDTRQYRWNTDTGATICQGNDLYTREDYEYSEDEGQTWQKTGNVRVGTLVEEDSETCTSATKQYEFRIDNTRWVCVGTTSYYYEVRYESTDGVNWIKSEPEVIQQSGTIRLQDDPQCGGSSVQYRWVDDGDNTVCDYDDSTPRDQTRWVTMSNSDFRCEGYDKYSIEKEQQSTDYGKTWSDTGNTRTGSIIAYNSSDCGYEILEEWRVEENGYICVNGNKYVSLQRYLYREGEWGSTTERKCGDLIESGSTDCVGVESDDTGRMYLFIICGRDTYECVDGYRIYKVVRNRNLDMLGLNWEPEGIYCGYDSKGNYPVTCE